MRRSQLPVVDFAISLYPTHPELRKPVRWADFLAMAERSKVDVKLVPLSRPARMLRYAGSLGIRINRDLCYNRRMFYGMHELCHVWRDEAGEACIYADTETVRDNDSEDFADLFAWFITSDARQFWERHVRPRRGFRRNAK